MPNHLSLGYDFSNDPGDDFGWLRVSGEGNGFAATVGMWVQWQNVVEWAAKLAAYPLPASGIEKEWGFTEDGTYHRVIYIRLKQSAPTGRIAVWLCLRDYYEPTHYAEFGFETAYSSLGNFKKEVERLMARVGEQATLTGD